MILNDNYSLLKTHCVYQFILIFFPTAAPRLSIIIMQIKRKTTKRYLNCRSKSLFNTSGVHEPIHTYLQWHEKLFMKNSKSNVEQMFCYSKDVLVNFFSVWELYRQLSFCKVGFFYAFYFSALSWLFSTKQAYTINNEPLNLSVI